MSNRVRRFAIWVGSAVVVLGGVAAFAFILVVTNPSNAGRTATGSPGPSASGPPSSAWLVTGGPGGVRMPDGADCAACHVTAGGAIGVKAIPVIAHPVHGWEACTSCHANDTLVAAAPGHTGIHANECLICHRASSGPAPTPRHPTMPDSDCLACHGPLVPIPSDMVNRDPKLCWLCHHS